jgi:predicted nucleic acid-binding protein
LARVLVDTSAVYALLDRSDSCHASAKKSLESFKRSRSEPLLTNFIVAECHALALARLGASVARAWLVSNAWAIERVTEEDEAKAKAIIRKYVDKTFSYADATSFAVMERLGLRTAFAFDPHFRQYGFEIIGPSPRSR